MAVRNIKNSWWIDIRINHTRYRKRSPENSKAGAQAYESVVRHKLARGESIEPVSAPESVPTFEEFAWKWFEDYVLPNNKFLEQRSKKYILSASLIPFFGKMNVGQITSHDIERYKAHLVKDGVKNKTIKNRLTVLNKLLSTAWEWLEIKQSQPKVKWPKCVSCRTDFLSFEECTSLLSHVDGVLGDMILTTIRTGMRAGEITGLQWSAIDWHNRILTVRHSRCDRQKAIGPTKSNRERHVPMDTDVYELLFKRMKSTGYVFTDARNDPFDTSRINKELEKKCKEVGLRRITWHVLRHTFASHLAMRGAPITVVQQLLGHSSITTTMRYSHVAPSTLRSAIDLLNPKTLINENFGQPVGNQWLERQRQEMTNKNASPKDALFTS
jgi:integrase